MTFLSDKDIRGLIAAGDLIVDPFDDFAVGPCSIDLRLGPELLRYTPQRIALGHTVPKTESVKILEEGFDLAPGEFVLGMTAERIRIPNGYHGRIETKGDIARAGIQVHANDAHIDAGTDGHITLELTNLHRADVIVKLMQDIYICQLFIEKLSSPVEYPYSGKYAHQSGPTPYIPAGA